MQMLFVQICALILVATFLAIILRECKIPPIVAYLLTGVIAGPTVLNLAPSTELMQTLASFGIAFLLFLVGLELDFTQLKTLGKSASLVGVGQIVATVGLGYLIIRCFGVSGLASWYLALGLAFSSTIIVVKLLSEGNELDSLYGRITINMLLQQDVVAILALIVLATMGVGAGQTVTQVAFALLRGFGFGFVVWLASKYVLPKLFGSFARSAELLFLSALSWCFLLTLIAAWLGFSLEIGAFIAGVALASLPYNLEISARVRSLRDFFITLFFVALGSQLTILNFTGFGTLFTVLVIFVVIGNPLIVFTIMTLLKYRPRLSFRVGLTVGMVSEFSLVLVGLGLRLGHVTPAEASMVTAVAVVTFITATLAVSHSDTLYRWFEPLLTRISKHTVNPGEPELLSPLSGHVVLIGYHRLGEKIAATLEQLGKKILVVDFNPDVISTLHAQHRLCLYGDMSEVEVLARACVNQAEMVISTNSNFSDNLALLKNIKRQAAQIPVYVTANTWHDCKDLYTAGADYVIFPHYLSGEHFSLILRELALNRNRLLVDRTKHLEALERHYGARTRA